MDILIKQYNARHSTPREIATTFVPPSFFGDLLEPTNTLVIGPRGSGKTTLLKMLTPPAMEAWDNPKADSYKNKVEYTAVYIPSDITWREQFIALENTLKDQVASDRFARAAFTCHFYRAFVSALMNRVERYLDLRDQDRQFRRVSFAASQEDDLARRLASHWMMPGPAPTLPILREMLSVRIEEIYYLAEIEAISGSDGRNERLLRFPWLFKSYLHSISTILDIANQAFGESAARWAFLFDELEIAPLWLQRELYSSLHSLGDQRVLLKLAMAPYMPFMPKVPDATPAGRQDYTQIRLWDQDRKHALEFCRAIWDQLFNEKQLPSRSPEEVLGQSIFGGEELGKYQEGSDFATVVAELMDKDESFALYITKNAALPSQWNGMSEERRAQLLRKAYPIVYLRNYYLKAGGTAVKRKSRKAHGLFAGHPATFVATDGNPRLLKGVLSALIDAWGDKHKRIDASVQERILRQAAKVFKSTLSTAVVPQPKVGKWGTGIVSLLECIGGRLREHVYGARFDPDPKLTFKVDDHVPSEMAEAIGAALNRGCIVQVSEPDEEAIGDVFGKRFRLCYFFALLERLPFRLGPPLQLSDIVSAQSSFDYAISFDDDDPVEGERDDE